MIQYDIKLSNRCNFQPEDPGVTTTKVIVDLELKFSCAKSDVNELFDRILLRNGDNFNKYFLDHTIEFMHGIYQG